MWGFRACKCGQLRRKGLCGSICRRLMVFISRGMASGRPALSVSDSVVYLSNCTHTTTLSSNPSFIFLLISYVSICWEASVILRIQKLSDRSMIKWLGWGKRFCNSTYHEN